MPARSCPAMPRRETGQGTLSAGTETGSARDDDEARADAPASAPGVRSRVLPAGSTPPAPGRVPACRQAPELAVSRTSTSPCASRSSPGPASTPASDELAPPSVASGDAAAPRARRLYSPSSEALIYILRITTSTFSSGVCTDPGQYGISYATGGSWSHTCPSVVRSRTRSRQSHAGSSERWRAFLLPLGST